MVRWKAALSVVPVVTVVVTGCGPSDTRIIGECEVASEAVRALPADGAEPVPAAPSIGLLDGRTFLSWSILTPERFTEQYGQWLDASLEEGSERFHIGTSRHGFRSRWVELDGALVGQVWAFPDGRMPPTPEQEQVHVWRVPLPGGEMPEHVGMHSAGAQAWLPAVVRGGRVVGALTATWNGCPGPAGPIRMFTFRPTFLRLGPTPPAMPVVWGEDPCDQLDPSLEATNAWLFALPEGQLGALIRLGDATDGRLRLIRIADDNSLDAGPTLVGGDHTNATVDGGYQPRAVVVPGDRILFTERRGDGENHCHAVRVMHLDGSDAKDAPWQIPCLRGADTFTSAVELEAVPGGAVLVWNEHTDIRGWITEDVEHYEESIRAVLLTPEGQRGSEIVTVTPPESTVLEDLPRTELRGPVPREYHVATAAEEDRVGVTWRDRRTDAPGVYVRHLRCTVDP